MLGTLRPSPLASQLLLSPPTPPSRPISLVTQCSVDRIDRLSQLLSAWRGPASVAVYIPYPQGSPEASAAIDLTLSRIRLEGGVGERCSQLSLSLSYQPHADAQYPINALRNIALKRATTELVFLLDVDFVPSANLLHHLSSQSGKLPPSLSSPPSPPRVSA